MLWLENPGQVPDTSAAGPRGSPRQAPEGLPSPRNWGVRRGEEEERPVPGAPLVLHCAIDPSPLVGPHHRRAPAPAAVRLRGGQQAASAEELDSGRGSDRSEEHTSELQSQSKLVCRLLFAK